MRSPFIHFSVQQVVFGALISMLALLPGGIASASAEPTTASAQPTLEVPSVLLRGLNSTIRVSPDNPTLTLYIDQQSLGPGAEILFTPASSGPVKITLRDPDGEIVATAERLVLPGWLSIAPPVLAFVLALVFRQVIPALFVGIWVGAFLVIGPSLGNLLPSLLQSVSTYAVRAVTDSGHATLMLFTFMIGGLVALISRNGGTRGIVSQITGWAHSRSRGQFATFAMGLLFFFDDYANTLVVGKTMRPVTDFLKISREKLAYLVDSTAAPVATLAMISSWIGFQLGLIDDAINKIPGLDLNAYSVFLNSLAYNFYPLLTLLFVALIALSGRDFGPMAKAEQRAQRTGALVAPDAKVVDDGDAHAIDPKADIPTRAANAYVPLATVLVTMLATLYITGVNSVGSAAPLRDIIGASDSYLALTWATLLGVIVAVGLSIAQRLLTLAEAMDTWYAGCKTMLLAIIVLVLAWSLSNVNEELRTAQWLAAQLSDHLDARLLPAIVFVMAALTAFATGTSWGVMGILLPLVIPLTWSTLELQGIAAPLPLLYSCVSAVLAGAVMGDHCSPISDTTILSSMATSCDLVDHVRTQLPYALLVGAVSIAVGLLPTAYGVPWWLALLACAALLWLIHRVLGQSVTD
ncbi:MAG: Na+/H+ antiporter NhaC family protein [Pseudomonadales bacterium]